MSKKNEAIGEVECPAKGCALKVPVYRFRGRQNEKMQRFANKLYCRCPVHGQFGGAAGDDAMQDYIAEHSKKCANERAGSSDKKSATAVMELPAIPAQLPAAPALQKAPAVQAKTTPAKPAAEPAAPAKKAGFGFFS
jgi:hypothetical protein